MKKILVLSILMLFIFKSEAQTDLNNYEYVVIPLQYEFLKGKDVYRLNTLTRVLFKGEGFKAYFNEEQLPEDLFKDRCLALYPDVKKVKGGPFKKKVQIILKDCMGNVVHESDIGDSKENNHQKAYNEALRKAFKSIERLNYSYSPQEKKEIEVEENETEEVEKESAEEKIVSEDIEENEVYEIVVEDPSVSKPVEEIKTYPTIVLKAKEIKNGYLFLDENDEVLYKARKTMDNEIFVLEGITGIIHKFLGKWIVEYYEGDVHNTRFLEIKF